MKRRRRKSLSSSLGIKKSVSYGPKGSKLNLSTKGIKYNSTNPFTGKRKSTTLMSFSSRARSPRTTTKTQSTAPVQKQTSPSPSTPHDSNKPVGCAFAAAVLVCLIGVLVSQGDAAFTISWGLLLGLPTYILVFRNVGKKEEGNQLVEQSVSTLQPMYASSPAASRAPTPSQGGDQTTKRPEWVDPSNSTWEDYEEFFFHDRGHLMYAPQWRQVLKVCHAHWNMERSIIESYRRREIDGVEPAIPLCRDQIAIAPQAKVALEMHDGFLQKYMMGVYKQSVADWKRMGLGDYPGYEPVDRPFKLPEHKGFKQLAIIYDKMKDHQAAIEVCQEALAVDWPGDWDIRIARYQRRLDNATKKKNKKPKVSGNVITIDNPPAASRPNFCISCGHSLEGEVTFCSQCGNRIQDATAETI